MPPPIASDRRIGRVDHIYFFSTSVTRATNDRALSPQHGACAQANAAQSITETSPAQEAKGVCVGRRDVRSRGRNAHVSILAFYSRSAIVSSLAEPAEGARRGVVAAGRGLQRARLALIEARREGLRGPGASTRPCSLLHSGLDAPAVATGGRGGEGACGDWGEASAHTRLHLLIPLFHQGLRQRNCRLHILILDVFNAT